MEKYGFVYIWFDRKHGRFYIGCHWGREDDGYICSSQWMRKAFRLRPDDFKRRIVARVTTTRHDLLTEEHRWLSMIKDHELKVRYYNASKKHFGHWSSTLAYGSIKERLSAATKEAMQRPEVRAKALAWSNHIRGKTLEEIHGHEKAAAIKAKKRMPMPSKEELAVILKEHRPYHAAKLLGVSNKTITKWAKEYKLPLDEAERKPLPMRPKKLKAKPEPKRKPRPSHEELRRLYIDDQMTLEQLGEHCGVHLSTVSLWLNHYGISRPRVRRWKTKPEAIAA